MYDKYNIFAKILRKEIPCQLIYENNYVLSFYDIYAKANIHALVIPKGEYTNLTEFLTKAEDKVISEYFKAFTKVIRKLDLDKKGYRIISNCGINGGQEVPHLHFHLLGGENLGPMVCKHI